VREPVDVAEVYPDAVLHTQIADALRALIHQTNLPCMQGHASMPAEVADPLNELFQQGVLVGQYHPTTGGKPTRARQGPAAEAPARPGSRGAVLLAI